MEAFDREVTNWADEPYWRVVHLVTDIEDNEDCDAVVEAVDLDNLPDRWRVVRERSTWLRRRRRSSRPPR